MKNFADRSDRNKFAQWRTRFVAAVLFVFGLSCLVSPSLADASYTLPKMPDQTIRSSGTLVFVDSEIVAVDVMLARLPADAIVHVMSKTGDAIAEMATVAKRHRNLSAIHILSHGRKGGVQFGPRFYGVQQLENAQEDLRALGAALDSNGDIFLYGCDVAVGDDASGFVDRLAVLTGADVAASNNATGTQTAGGDWTLEILSGKIEQASLSIENWNGVLVYTTATLDWATAANLTKGTTADYTYNGSATALQFLIAGSGNIFNDYTANFTGGTNDATTLMQPASTSITTGQTTTMTFNAGGFPVGVETVTFDLRNIDANAGGWDDRLLITAFDINNVQVTGLNITATPRNVTGQTYSITTLANGVQLDGNIDGAGGDNHPQDSVGLSITSTTGVNIGRVVVLYTSGTAGTSTGIVGIGDIGMRYNMPPVLDLDSSGAGTGFNNTYVANTAGINFADTDTTVIDLNDTNIVSATITLTNPFTFDEIFVSGALPGGIVASAYNTTTGVITLSGSATKANYETAIEALRFRSTIANPNTTTRVITVVVSDGINSSNTTTANIAITPVMATLTLAKTVTNDNGGTAAVSGFTLTATGPTNITGITGAATVTNAAVTAGTYTLTEAGPAGYTMGAWACTAGTLTGNSLLLAVGQIATCTVNNNDISPRLTLVKTVTNDNGGTAAVSAFTLTATGPTTITGVTGAVAVSNAAVNAGTYTLTEAGPTGYTMGAWACTAGTLTGNSLVLAVGQTATCTVNNNDTAPRLTLAKTVTNDNGGSSAVSAFTLTATGPTTITGITGAGTVTNAAVNAGTYTLTEAGPAGYTMGAWACTAGTLTGNSLVLTVGQTATCTVNNNDISPVLTLVKTVTNDNGGTAAVSAFTLTATGPTNITGITGAGTVTNAAVNAGTYVLTESGPAGYAMGAWACTAGTLTGNSLVLALGQTATCTVNNNDISPRLTLAKTVTDLSGGPSTVPSFTLTATGPTTISGITSAGTVTNAAVNVGTYVLTETGPAGYTAGAWSCTAGTLTGNSLVLALAQTATCTINNVKLPTLIIRKISNGAIDAFDFSGTNGVPNQTIATSTVGVAANGATLTLASASTATQITEVLSGTTPWEIQTHACTGMGTGGAAPRVGNVITLDTAATAPGANIICTVTNRRRPFFSVQKITTGGFGGSFTFADVNLTGSVAAISTIAANTATPASPADFIATTTGSLVTITESFGLSFVSSGATCSDANAAITGSINPVATSTGASITVPATAVLVGADITCVFTNAQAAPQLAVAKSANVASVSAAGQTINYAMLVTNSGNTILNAITMTDPLGSVICPTSGNATIATLAVGGTETCSLSYVATQTVFNNNGGGDGDIDNTAVAATTYNGSPVSGQGSTQVTLVITPNLALTKQATAAGPFNAGDMVTYRFRATNTGNVTLTGLNVADSSNGNGNIVMPANETVAIIDDVAPTGDSTDAISNGTWDTLAPGDTVEFMANYIVVQQDVDWLQ